MAETLTGLAVAFMVGLVLGLAIFEPVARKRLHAAYDRGFSHGVDLADAMRASWVAADKADAERASGRAGR
jgi:hypothetical protein